MVDCSKKKIWHRAFAHTYQKEAWACFLVVCMHMQFGLFIKIHSALRKVTFLAPENTTTLDLLSLVWNGNKVWELNLASGVVTKDWRSQLLLRRHTQVSWREEICSLQVTSLQKGRRKKKNCLAQTLPPLPTNPGFKLPPNLYLTEQK